MKKLLSTTTIILLITPFFVNAAEYLGPIDDFFAEITSFINSYLIPLLFALALLVFIYGMFNYFIVGGGDEQKRTQGKQLMIWGIIGFVMMVIIWGVVNLIANGITAGLGSDGDRNTLDNIPGTPIQAES